MADNREQSALESLASLPFVRDRGSFVEIDKQAILDARNERMRRMGVTSVPSIPRDVVRDVGGAFPRGLGRWPSATFDQLRAIRETAPILQPIHKARNYQIRRMCTPWPGRRGTVGIRVVHKDYQEWNAIPPEGFEKYVHRFEKVLWAPAPVYRQPTLGSVLAPLMEDLLTINRPVVEIIPAQLDPQRILMFKWVDGGYIWETLLWIEKWKADNPRWASGYKADALSDEDAIDIVSAQIDHDLHGAEYVCVRDGIAEATYAPGRLLVGPLLTRTDARFAGYPPSHVEEAYSLIKAFISGFDYNTTLLSKGILTNFLLGIPADMHDDDKRAFVHTLREATQGVARAGQPGIIPLHQGQGVTKIDLGQPQMDVAFEALMSLTLALTTGVYRMDPSVINAKPWDGGAAAHLSEANRTQEIALAKEEGLQGDLGHLLDTLINPLAKRCHPDLRVIAEYGDYDATKEAGLYEINTRTWQTPNEARLEMGRRPLGYFLTDEKYEKASDEEKAKHDANENNQIANTVLAQARSQAAMAAQQQQQPGAPGQDDQQPGADDGFGGRDDGFGGAAFGQDPAPFGKPQQSDQDQDEAQPMAKAATRVVHVHLTDRTYP